MAEVRLLHQDLTDQIIEAYYHVYNTLGPGFLEKVYETALLRTLQRRGLSVVRQAPINVWFEEEIVGEYFADLVVAAQIIVELKVAARISPEQESQLLNYLKASDIELGFIMNFGEKPEFKRKILTNDRKQPLRTVANPGL